MTDLQTDAEYAKEVRASQRYAQKVERKSVLFYRMLMAGMLAIAIIAFIPINAAHNFQYFENMVGAIDEGTGWYTLYVAMAVGLVVVSAGLWMLLPDTDGAIWGLCLSVALGAGLFSHYASYLSLDTQSVAKIQQETANSTKSKIAMMGVEAMSAQLKAAAKSSETAAAAVGNLTAQYGNYDAASVGEINRKQLPTLTGAQHSASLDMRAASTAMERAMAMATEASGGSGEGTLANVFRDFGAQWGWTPEGTRVFTNAFGSGVISWVPLIITFVMGYVAFKKPASASPADEGEQAEQEEQPPAPRAARTTRHRAMASSASDVSDTIRGPVLDDPIELDDPLDADPPSPPRAMFAPKKRAGDPPETTGQTPARKKSEMDRAPGTKRQANFAKQLARLKAAIGPGKTFAPGQRMNVEDIKRVAQANGETAGRLRDALVLDGAGHWKGKSIIAG